MQQLLQHHEVRRAAKFGIVGVINTVLDFSIFTVLHHLLAWPYLWANVVAFLTASINSYFFNRRWTFRSSATDIHRELTQYIVVVGVGFLINEAALYVAVDRYGWPPLVGKVAATAFSLVWNFLANRLWTFRGAVHQQLADRP